MQHIIVIIIIIIIILGERKKISSNIQILDDCTSLCLSFLFLT